VEEIAMNENVLDRRRVLMGAGAAGAVAIGGVASASSASAGENDGGSSLNGSWIVSRKDDPPGDQTKVSTVLSFAGGNVMISHDIAPAGPPFTGTWARRSGGGFKATFWTGQAGGGPNMPGVTVRVRTWGSVHHGRIRGTYDFAVFDPSGTKVDSGTGSFSGRRIDA